MEGLIGSAQQPESLRGARATARRDSPVNMTFGEKAGHIASPITACPTQALCQEFWIVFEGSQNLTMWVVLHVGLVTMRHHPPCEKVVIIGVQLVLAKPPFLVGETIGEVDILKDARAVGTGASGETWHTAVHVGGRRTVKVSTFQIQGTEESIDAS